MARRASSAEERASILGLLKAIARLGTDTKAMRRQGRARATPSPPATTRPSSSPSTPTRWTSSRSTWPSSCRASPSRATPGAGGEVRDHGGLLDRVHARSRSSRRCKDGSVQLLVCTDAAAEGLNFQSCGVLVNFDLPWNPMKVEQRIGRIDRIGQKYPVIRVVNLAYEDTVEADVYFALGGGSTCSRGSSASSSRSCRGCPGSSRRWPWRRRRTARPPGSGSWPTSRAWPRRPTRCGFDIDEVADEAIEVPDLPEPALTLADLDAALNTPRRPARRGRSGRGSTPAPTSSASPAWADWVRVTTSADVFDDHFESHEFLSPGGPLFESLAAPSAEGSSAPGDGRGHCWLVESGGECGACEMIVLAPDGARRVDSLGDLLVPVGRSPES